VGDFMGVDARSVATADAGTVVQPDGAQTWFPADRPVTFGRGPDVDVFVAGGREVSRVAGEIVPVAGGLLVVNRSRKHALYVQGAGYNIRLPPSGEGGPPGGWLVLGGTVTAGSMTMIHNGLGLQIVVDGHGHGSVRYPSDHAFRGNAHQEGTLPPIMLRPDTKLFLVALLLCRPWLLDPSHVTALPSAPQIARAALEVTDASHQLARFDHEPGFRRSLIEQVNDHLKYLRHRLIAGGLARAGSRLTVAMTAEMLLANDVITPADLAWTDDPGWRSRQEDLWWTTR
jgi:hypothetical protein